MALTIDMHTTTINRAELLLFHQNSQSKNTNIVVAANWHSGSGPEPAPVGMQYQLTPYESLFFNQAPTFIDNLNETNLDPALRDLLLQQKVLSIAILPLWASKHQLGVLLLVSENKHSFTSRETRSYPPLVDQMATAIENQNLYERTQAALSETELLYQVNKGIAQANDPEALIHLVANQMLPETADRTALFSIIKTPDDNISGFEVVGYHDKKQEPSCLGMVIPMANLPYFLQLTEPEMIRGYSPIQYGHGFAANLSKSWCARTLYRSAALWKSEYRFSHSLLKRNDGLQLRRNSHFTACFWKLCCSSGKISLAD